MKWLAARGIQLLLILILLKVQHNVEAARILCIFPVPFDSHQSVFHVIIEELARRGHELVVITSLPHSTPLQNVTEIDLHDATYKAWEDIYTATLDKHPSSNTDIIKFTAEVLMPFAHKIIEIELLAPEVQKLILDTKQSFDVILMEACLMQNLVFVARFNAPVILVSSFYGTEGNFLTVGAAVHPFLFPHFNLRHTRFSSIRETFQMLYKYLWFRQFEWQLEIEGDALVRKHFGDKSPKFKELKKSVQMLFLNVHHIWDNNRPIPPSVIYIGGLQLKTPKEISHNLQSYLNSSNNGVVYVSLGSKLKFSKLPPRTVRVILAVLSSIPYDALIKCDREELPDKPENVRLEKWLPQNDMLHHPKIKAFITQGGLQSTDEAIAANVPLLALPVFGDQFYNAQKYVQHGIGMTLDINTIEEDDLRKAIFRLIEDESYRNNIARLSRIMKVQRAGGLQKAMYWLEYSAIHGAEHLRSPLADASLREYLLLDFIGLAALVFTLGVMCVFFMLRVFIIHVVLFVGKCRRKYKLD